MIRRSPAGKRGHQLLGLGPVPSDNTRAREQTCDDVADFVRVIVPAEEVGEPHDHQPQDGDEDADPLTGRQASAQEGDREQAGEDNDSPTQHLETGGTGHVESYNQRQKETTYLKHKKVKESGADGVHVPS